MTGVIDVHAHILPGIDDGSRDWDESRRLLEESYRQGIRYIIATPHYSRRGLPSDIYDLSEKLKEEARKIAPDFQIGLGQETYYHEGLIENLKNGRALTLDGSQYVLVEFEPQVPYMKMYQAVRKLTMARYIPIIAHVEEHEAFGRGKLLISLQFDKSVCNNQISLLLQNVSVWLLMRSGAFLPNHTSPTKR